MERQVAVQRQHGLPLTVAKEMFFSANLIPADRAERVGIEDEGRAVGDPFGEDLALEGGGKRPRRVEPRAGAHDPGVGARRSLQRAQHEFRKRRVERGGLGGRGRHALQCSGDAGKQICVAEAEVFALQNGEKRLFSKTTVTLAVLPLAATLPR